MILLGLIVAWNKTVSFLRYSPFYLLYLSFVSVASIILAVPAFLPSWLHKFLFKYSSQAMLSLFANRSILRDLKSPGYAGPRSHEAEYRSLMATREAGSKGLFSYR